MRNNWVLAGLLLATSPVAQAAAIHSLDGSGYLSVSASSYYGDPNPDYSPVNLFNEPSPVPNQEISTSTGSDVGSAWANGVSGQGPHFVEFELDSVYSIESIFYAQRDYTNGHNPAFDKALSISLWASTSTPFLPADPGGAPNDTINSLNVIDDTFTEYTLNSPVSGRYFVLSFTGQPGELAFIGGTELRLGVPEPTTGLMTGAIILATMVLHRRRSC